MQNLLIEGYAIVSADGMIADRDRYMPDRLKVEADARFFNDGLDGATLVVHGRHSHEQQGVASERRRRLIVTDRDGPFGQHPDVRNAWLWNPASLSFKEVCRALEIRSGKVAVTGGTGVFGPYSSTAPATSPSWSSRNNSP
jgi:hypothetical protein